VAGPAAGGRAWVEGVAPPPGTYPGLPAGLPPALVALYERAQPYLQTRFNDQHVQASLQYAARMLAEEGGDADLVATTIILHDLGWSQISEEQQRQAFGPNSTDAETNRRHELESVRLAGEILEETALPDAFVREVLRIIDTHDSSPEALTAEEAIVKDADKLWRVSQIGFPLQIESMFDGITGQQLHDFIAVRAPVWFLTPSGLALARAELDARRADYGLAPAPNIPPPPGYGIGDRTEYDR